MFTSDQQPFPVNEDGLHKLYDPEQFAKAIADVIQVMQANRVEPLKAMVLALEQRGPYRLLSPLLTRPWVDLRDLLESNYPHFAEVIEPVKQAWHLAYHSHTAFALPPLLLLGEPGIGKTHFTAQLAKCINLQYPQIPRLKQAIMVRWGGSRFSARFRVLRDDIFSDISLIAVVFARDSGIRTLPIRASGSYVHRAVRDPGGACPYAQVIRVQGRE